MSGIEAAFFGVLTRDAEAKVSKNGKAYARLNIRLGDGEAQWINVTSFDQQAIAAVDKLTKGARVYVEGSLTLNKWTGQDGVERHGLSVMSWHTRLAAIGRNKSKRERNGDEVPAGANAAAHKSTITTFIRTRFRSDENCTDDQHPPTIAQPTRRRSHRVRDRRVQVRRDHRQICRSQPGGDFHQRCKDWVGARAQYTRQRRVGLDRIAARHSPGNPAPCLVAHAGRQARQRALLRARSPRRGGEILKRSVDLATNLTARVRGRRLGRAAARKKNRPVGRHVLFPYRVPDQPAKGATSATEQPRATRRDRHHERKRSLTNVTRC